MKGTISHLHEEGSTNKTSDQRPVVLLNSNYQLLYYIINERLKRIVERANVLEPEQGGDRRGRSVDFDMQKMHFVAHAMKPTDKKSESIESTSTSETPLLQCRRQLSGT